MNSSILPLGNYRQPILTGLETVFGDDHRADILFRELIYRANNHPNYPASLANKIVVLKRGEVIFGRNKFSEYLGWSGKSTERVLQRVQAVYQLVTIQPSHNYTIVSIKNYDELVKLTNLSTNQQGNRWPSDGQVMTTSKTNRLINAAITGETQESIPGPNTDTQPLQESGTPTVNKEANRAFWDNRIATLLPDVGDKSPAAISKARQQFIDTALHPTDKTIFAFLKNVRPVSSDSNRGYVLSAGYKDL